MGEENKITASFGTASGTDPGTRRRPDWGPEHLGRVRTELLAAYRDIECALADEPPGSPALRILENATRVLAEQAPVWVSARAHEELWALPPSPLYSEDLTGLSGSGMAVFADPVAQTRLSEPVPYGIAAVEGALWWSTTAGELTGTEEAPDPGAPLVVIHPLARQAPSGTPFPTGLWEGSTLRDLGMVVVPVGSPMLPENDDDLAPLLCALAMLGCAAAFGDASLEPIGPRPHCRAAARRPVSVLPRPVQVLVGSGAAAC